MLQTAKNSLPHYFTRSISKIENIGIPVRLVSPKKAKKESDRETKCLTQGVKNRVVEGQIVKLQ